MSQPLASNGVAPGQEAEQPEPDMHDGTSPRSSLSHISNNSNADPPTTDWKSWLLETISLPHSVPHLIFYFFIAGIVDAITISGFNLVFCSNQTGNFLFLGIAAVGGAAASVESPIPHATSFLCFTVGAMICGQLLKRIKIKDSEAASRVRAVFMFSDLLQALLLGAGALMSWKSDTFLAILGVLAFGMGIQGAHGRLSGVTELSATTVITSVLIDLISDPKILSPFKANIQRNRRVMGILAMFAGAVIGATFVDKVTAAAGLAFCFGAKILCVAAWTLVPGEQKK